MRRALVKIIVNSDEIKTVPESDKWKSNKTAMENKGG